MISAENWVLVQGCSLRPALATIVSSALCPTICDQRRTLVLETSMILDLSLNLVLTALCIGSDQHASLTIALILFNSSCRPVDHRPIAIGWVLQMTANQIFQVEAQKLSLQMHSKSSTAAAT